MTNENSKKSQESLSDQNHVHSTKKYWIICIVLVVITAMEYFIFKIDNIRDNPYIMYPALGAMSLVKLFLVVASYMHLETEPKILKRIFFFCMFLALLVFIILCFTSPVKFNHI